MITVNLYINAQSDSTKQLRQFIAKHIDAINDQIFINQVKVTKANLDQIKKMGILHTPTLVYANRKYVGLEKIIRILTPHDEQKASYGIGNTSAEDLITQYQDTIMRIGAEEEDEPDEMDPDVRKSQLQKKMAAMQKRRPEMSGVSSGTKLPGGRKIKQSTPKKTSFVDDDDFQKTVGDGGPVQETPSRRYAEEDGDLILENYYLDMARDQGKKVGKTVSKKR